jgi:hypothetical protein
MDHVAQFLLKKINLSGFYVLSQHLGSAIKIPTIEKILSILIWDVGMSKIYFTKVNLELLSLAKAIIIPCHTQQL